MRENKSRFDDPKMNYYKETYKNSPLWDGKDSGKRLIIYGEQGNGDIIQFARYFKLTNNYTILHAPKCLHSLLSPLVNEVIDKDDPTLPEHDYHIPSLSMPFVMDIVDAPVPYLSAPKMDVGFENEIKIGIAWEGNPNHQHNRKRSCPLHNFKKLKGKLFALQNEIHLPKLITDCEDMEIYSVPMNDFMDLASLIQAMDYVVSVDTAALHLAGALGKKGFGILNREQFDSRWDTEYKWYQSLKISKGSWSTMIEGIQKLMS